MTTRVRRHSPLLVDAEPDAFEVLRWAGATFGDDLVVTASFGDAVAFDATVPEWQQRITADAQTSGGLLAAVAPDSVDEVLALFHREGFAAACVVGELQPGEPRIRVTP